MRNPRAAPAAQESILNRSSAYVPLSQNFCHRREFVREFAFPYHLVMGELRSVDKTPRISPLQLEMPLDFLGFYHQSMELHASRWEKRAKRIKAGLTDGNLKYANDRARTLRMDPFARVAQCGKRKAVVRCGCRHVRVPVPCGVRWLCPQCQRSTARKQFKKLKRAMMMHTHSQERARKKSSWRLLTLTIRHSGDLALDRARITRGWKRFRQWCWAKVGKFPFAMVWELTPGRDGRGHLHAHVAVMWPRIDYHEVRAEWIRATDNHSQRINIQEGRKGPGGAANYLSKYVSKGLDLTVIPPFLAASAIFSSYNQRLVTTSHRFWKPREPRCPTCHELFELTQRPAPLRDSAPFAVWDADVRRCMVASRRAPPIDSG